MTADYLDLVWEADGIGAEIKRTRGQVYRLLAIGAIKSAKRVGGRWCADRNALRREFGALGVGRDADDAEQPR
jgi:hypothetical protein